MKLVKSTDQIKYLVKRKFPGSSAPPPINPLSSRSNGGSSVHESYQKPIVDKKAYECELLKKTEAEVKSLYDEEYEKELNTIQLKTKFEEQSRFFNQPYANADFVHWSKAAHWTLDEALALSFGKSPDIVSWDKIKQFNNISAFAKDYEKRRDLALRELPWGKLFDPMLPTIFINWAIDKEIELPNELIEKVQKRLANEVNWFEEYRKIKDAYDELQNKASPPKVVAEKPLSARTENNYLRLIFKLAYCIEGFNPTKPYEAASLIIDVTAIEKISQETIAKFITKAHALDSKEKD
ncbi:MAG: hypothetical protein CTY37_05200 [Methylotenera sp.]|nr:MAG: hypothetical protein CTY37_05200 [Methylotenera sp.]PPD18623.1 MAG: hypothetical protein CTY27_01200 [Methylotenera sp.]